jgi:hypothetical protein
MADQNTILRTLAASQGPMTLDEVCRAECGRDAPVGSAERKQVTKAIGRLIGRGLVRTVQPQVTTFPASHGGYDATKEGRMFVQEGRRVSEHVLDYPAVTKPKEGAKAKGEAFREALWKAFRFSKKATLHELIEVAGDQGVIKVETLAGAWMKALIRAGVAVELKVRAHGFAPTSNGFKRYALARDLGAKAPSIAHHFIIDNNSGQQIAFDQPAASREVA